MIAQPEGGPRLGLQFRSVGPLTRPAQMDRHGTIKLKLFNFFNLAAY
jgi:hypothetical protein